MKLIIHDLGENGNRIKIEKDSKLINATGPKAPCIGCFGCWIKTPSKCVLRDRIQDMGKDLATCDELIIISKSIYGGLSFDTKNILDRSISYLLPFFRNINKEQHHTPRYKQQFKLKVIIYNLDEILKEEKKMLEKYIKAVSINFNVSNLEIKFFNNIGELYL